jgi:hypothetical protein
VLKLSQVFQFTNAQKIATLLVLAFLPFQLITAQQGRVYAIFTLLYLVGLYTAVSGLWVYFGIAIVGLLWSHYISILFIPTLFIIAFILHPKNWKKILVAVSLAGITFLPWIPVFLNHASNPIPWFRPLDVETFILSGYYSLFGWGLPGLIPSFALLYFTLFPILLIMDYIFGLFRLKSTLLFVNLRNGFIGNRSKNPSPANWLNSYKGIAPILFSSFIVPLILMTAVSIYLQNIIIYRTLSLIMPSFIMWLVFYIVGQKSNLIQKAFIAGSVCLLAIGILFWSPTQIGGDILRLSSVVENSFRYSDAFYHNTGLTAMIFKYYFPNRPQYLIDGNDTLGLIDLSETKTNIQRLSFEKVPAQRLWVVWSRAEDLKIINRSADERFANFVQKCQIVGFLKYPESWDVEVYLCSIK